MSRPATKVQQVCAQIEQRFVRSDSPAAVLPSERLLAQALGVSRSTVRAAIKMSEDNGVLRTAHGVGTFVVAPHVSKAPQLSSFSEDVRSRGWRPGSRVVAAITRQADVDLAHEMGLRAGDEVVELERVRFADDVPLSVERVRMPSTWVPGLLDHDLTGSLYALLDSKYDIRIVRHDRRISAINLDAASAAVLEVGEGAAALYVVQTGYDQRGRRVEFGRSIYRGDRYDFATVTVRSDPVARSAL